MLNGISTGASNQIQSFTAANAFKSAQDALKNEKRRIEENTPSGVDLKDNNVLLKSLIPKESIQTPLSSK